MWRLSARSLFASAVVSIASDGGALNLNVPGKPHPRSFGTNVRVLGKYVRDEKTLTLEDAVRKMTSFAGADAERSWTAEGGSLGGCRGLRSRNRFGPPAYQTPQQYAKGVLFVLVNGTMVIDVGQRGMSSFHHNRNAAKLGPFRLPH